MSTMTRTPRAFDTTAPTYRWNRSWPAYWAAGWIGAFCGLVLLVAGYNQLFRGMPLDVGGKIALFATGLRLFTVAIALAAVQSWGRRLPGWLVFAGLCGVAAAQLLYPLAETTVKLAILVGVVQPFGKGISNMSAEGWFNFGAAWLIWGVPGVLFAAAAVSFKRRYAVSALGAALGLLGGAAALLALGFIIG